MAIVLAPELAKDNKGSDILEPETMRIKLLGDSPVLVACCISAD